MSINEKIIFDYNVFYEECLQAFIQNPIIVAQRLLVATELYDSITEKSIELSDLSDGELMKLTEMDNIFDTFVAHWLKKQNNIHALVESAFMEMLMS